MLYEPNSNVYLCRVPLKNDKQSTLSFASLDSQYSYFNSKIVASFSKGGYVYIRKDKAIRVPFNIEKLWNVNYIMYQNATMGNKWFYCFVEKLEYVNTETTLVTFSTDVFQTWLFDLKVGDCYVEREHVSNDAKFTNLVNEPVPLSDTVFQEIKQFELDWSQCYIVGCSYTLFGGGVVKARGRFINGTFCGCNLYVCDNLETYNLVIKEAQETADDSIVFVQIVPKWVLNLLTYNSSNGWCEQESFSTSTSQTLNFLNETIDGYTPKNNKCFNFPYNGLYVSNGQGNNDCLSFELFPSQSTITFSLYSEINCNACAIMKVNGYKGFTWQNDFNIPLGTYPQAQFTSYNYNSYSQSELQARINGSLGAIGQVGLSQTGSNIVNSLKDLSFMKAQQQNTPPTIHNVTGCSNLNYLMQGFKPVIARRVLKNDHVRKLDEYFTMYGYQVNTLKKPNLTGRPNHNFIKLAECNIYGNIPNEDLQIITNSFQSGFTFWHNPNTIYNYNVSNEV